MQDNSILSVQKIIIDDVAQRYNSLSPIIDDNDKWHKETERRIFKFIRRAIKNLPDTDNLTILNAGSAGNSYGLPEKNICHVDVASKHISHLQNAIVANIEQLPLPNDQFDLVICVGSVLNYCDPVLVVKEFTRVLKNRGYLILEFENSHTFELLFKKEFNKRAVFMETFFDAEGEKENIWYFSEEYIN